MTAVILEELKRRPRLLYGLMAVNVVVNALIPFMFLVSALILLLLSRRPENRALSRVYGLVILGGVLLAILARLVIR